MCMCVCAHWIGKVSLFLREVHVPSELMPIATAVASSAGRLAQLLGMRSAHRECWSGSLLAVRSHAPSPPPPTTLQSPCPLH